jgi:hypothetical protein
MDKNFSFTGHQWFALFIIHPYGLYMIHFNTVLRRLVAWIRSSLLVKIQWQKHQYLNMDVTLFGTCSHMTIMMWKVDTRTEGGARILIKESSIKAIEIWRILEKARLIYSMFILSSFFCQHLHMVVWAVEFWAYIGRQDLHKNFGRHFYHAKLSEESQYAHCWTKLKQAYGTNTE